MGGLFRVSFPERTDNSISSGGVDENWLPEKLGMLPALRFAESQRDSIPQPRLDPSRTGDPPSSDFGGTRRRDRPAKNVINPEKFVSLLPCTNSTANHAIYANKKFLKSKIGRASCRERVEIT